MNAVDYTQIIFNKVDKEKIPQPGPEKANGSSAQFPIQRITAVRLVHNGQAGLPQSARSTPKCVQVL